MKQPKGNSIPAGFGSLTIQRIPNSGAKTTGTLPLAPVGALQQATSSLPPKAPPPANDSNAQLPRVSDPYNPAQRSINVPSK